MANRVSIRPSVLGSKGLLLFAVLELAFLATNYSNLFFLMLSFSAALGLLSTWWSLRNLRDIQIRTVDIGVGPAGTSQSIQLRVVAPKRPRFDLMFEVDLKQERTKVCYTPVLVASQSLTDMIPEQRRGVQRIKQMTVTSRFPFGLFVAQTKLPITSEVVTYPNPIPFRGNNNARHQVGEEARPMPGKGSILAGLRAFRSGDNLSDVDWKATARRSSAVVKEREDETNQEHTAIFDRRCEREAFEHALSQLTSLALAASHARPLRIRSQGFEILVNANRSTTTDALRWLATTTALPPNAGSPPKQDSAIELPEALRSS